MKLKSRIYRFSKKIKKKTKNWRWPIGTPQWRPAPSNRLAGGLAAIVDALRTGDFITAYITQ